jgi:uncharacterized phage protein (TIGR02216 family)
MQIDWGAWMRVGLRDHRLDPDVFWQLTPAELMLIAGLEPSHTPMNRDRLSAMLDAFPDQEKSE